MTHEPVAQTAPAPTVPPMLSRAVRDGLIGGVGAALYAVFSAVLKQPALDTPPAALVLTVIGVALMVLSFGLSMAASFACVVRKQAFVPSALLWAATFLISGLVFNFVVLRGASLLLRALLSL